MGPLPYLLAGEVGSVGITASKHLPQVRVQPRASLIHAIGARAAVDRFRELLSPLFDGLSSSVTRVDLFADFQGLSLEASCRERFVRRAGAVRVFEEEGSFTGIQPGMRRPRPSPPTSMTRPPSSPLGGPTGGSPSGAMPTIHAPGPRVEFEIGRKAITDVGLDTPEQVLSATRDLWRYATEEWLTYRTASRSQRTRWTLAPEWLVQRVSLGSSAVGIDRVRAGRRNGTIRRIFPALAGYLATFGAAVGTTGIEDTLTALDSQLRNDEIARHTTFEERIARRRASTQV
jgi:hypothetical protein